MGETTLRFKKIHVNYVTTAPIVELLLKPNMIASPFSFLKNLKSYTDLYRKSFFHLHTIRNEKNPKGKIRNIYIKGLGKLEPIAGHELKNSPLYKAKGGNISHILGKRGAGIRTLPMKSFSNWRITLESNLLEKDEKFTCSPLVKIYPFGLVSYQVRIFLASKTGIDVKRFISLMKNIQELKVLDASGNKYSALSLIKKFHDTILENVITSGRMREDRIFSPVHRVVDISVMDGRLSTAKNDKELAAIIGLKQQWERLSTSYVEKYLGHFILGDYEGHFIFFHPLCTLIYAPNPALDPMYDSYIGKCIRNNYTSIVEMATLQSHFSQVLRRPLLSRLEKPPITLEGKEKLQTWLDELTTGYDWMLQPEYFPRLFKGAYEEFFDIIQESIGLERRTAENLKLISDIILKLKEVVTTLSIIDQVELGEIVNHLDEIYKICDTFSNENPLQLSSEVTLANAIKINSAKIRNSLMTQIEMYNDLGSEPFATKQEQFKLKSSIYNLVLSNYRTQILPNFQEFVEQILEKEDEVKSVSNEKREQGTIVPKEKEASQAINDAKELISEAKELQTSETFSEIKGFATKAKPYVEKIISAAKIVFTVLGFLA